MAAGGLDGQVALVTGAGSASGGASRCGSRRKALTWW